MKWLQNVASMLGFIAYVKDKGGNLSTMTIAFTSFVSCEVLGLVTPFVGSCWGHAMFKCSNMLQMIKKFVVA